MGLWDLPQICYILSFIPQETLNYLLCNFLVNMVPQKDSSKPGAWQGIQPLEDDGLVFGPQANVPELGAVGIEVWWECLIEWSDERQTTIL